MAPQDVRVTLAALLLEPSVEVVPRRKTRQWHHEVAPSPADQTLDAALVVAFTRTAVAVLDQAMRQEPAEEAGAFARATPRSSNRALLFPDRVGATAGLAPRRRDRLLRKGTQRHAG